MYLVIAVFKQYMKGLARTHGTQFCPAICRSAELLAALTSVAVISRQSISMHCSCNEYIDDIGCFVVSL